MCANWWMNVETGNYKVLKSLIDKRYDVNSKRAGDVTALHIAVKRGDVKMVKFLLSVGADPFIRDRGGETPKDCLSKMGLPNADIISKLLMKYELAQIVKKRKDDSNLNYKFCYNPHNRINKVLGIRLRLMGFNFDSVDKNASYNEPILYSWVKYSGINSLISTLQGIKIITFALCGGDDVYSLIYNLVINEESFSVQKVIDKLAPIPLDSDTIIEVLKHMAIEIVDDVPKINDNCKINIITIEEMRKCLPEKKRRFMDKLFAGLEHWKFMIKEIRMDDSRITIFVSGVPLFIGNVRSGIHPSLKMIQEGVTKFYFPKKMVRIICSLD